MSLCHHNYHVLMKHIHVVGGRQVAGAALPAHLVRIHDTDICDRDLHANSGARVGIDGCTDIVLKLRVAELCVCMKQSRTLRHQTVRSTTATGAGGSLTT